LEQVGCDWLVVAAVGGANRSTAWTCSQLRLAHQARYALASTRHALGL
jgi:hypothetical protein